jgi:hypothetical protein
VQITEGLRTDVAVVEREHPGISWTRRFLRTHKNVTFPLTEGELASWKETTDTAGTVVSGADRVFRAMIAAKQQGTLTRPLAVAPTVDPALYAPNAEEFRNHGMFMLWEGNTQDSTPDTTALRTCIGDIKAEEFTGTWTGARDRSPVRRFYTDGLASVISGLFLTYAEALIRTGRHADAAEMLTRAEAFEKQMAMGLTSGTELARLWSLMPGTSQRAAGPKPTR